jgi:8-oxo-dGTP diphosphatase
VPPEDRRRDVVGAAIVARGRVLAARRTAPRGVAGRWEFPGGKVEEGETPEAALVREIAEELGCTIEVTGWLAGSTPIGESHLLTVAVARLVAGRPVPHEHDRVRWLDRDRLDDVDWLEPDRPFLAELRETMQERMEP